MCVCVSTGGPDVYKGVVIDYKGESVNSDVFLAVLEGNKTAVKGMGSGKVRQATWQHTQAMSYCLGGRQRGSEKGARAFATMQESFLLHGMTIWRPPVRQTCARVCVCVYTQVIDSGPEDRVFVFYSDHGAVGVLGMPTGKAGMRTHLHTSCPLQRHPYTA